MNKQQYLCGVLGHEWLKGVCDICGEYDEETKKEMRKIQLLLKEVVYKATSKYSWRGR